MGTKTAPVIIIKKKSGHGGHHGGAWKVAYADFVTAMMSLFIVLWLMNSSDKVKKAVAGYFNDPKGTANLLGTTMSGNGISVVEDQSDLSKLKEKLEQEIKAKKELEKLSKQIEITITPEGLRIELLEDKNGTFFETGSAQLSANGQQLLSLLAGELKALPNSLLIEGHTDAMQYSSVASYSNWELSADRANSARRLMQQVGVRADQVTQVRGYADQFLRVKSNPYDPSNRRISILVKNSAKDAVPEIHNGQLVGELTGDNTSLGKTSGPSPAEEKPPTSADSKQQPAPDSPSQPAKSAGLMKKVISLLPARKK